VTIKQSQINLLFALPVLLTGTLERYIFYFP